MSFRKVFASQKRNENLIQKQSCQEKNQPFADVLQNSCF